MEILFIIINLIGFISAIVTLLVVFSDPNQRHKISVLFHNQWINLILIKKWIGEKTEWNI